jgi:hypothetical protein
VSLVWALLASSGYPVPAWGAEPGPAQSGFDAALAEANRRFVAGDRLGALQILEPACAGSARPECSFSLGAIQHGLGHCAQALEQYRRYRELAPRGEHAQEVAAALEEVEPRCGGGVPTRAAGLSPRASAAPALPGAFVAPPAPTAAPMARRVAVVDPAPLTGNTTLLTGSLVLSGAAAASSVVFGILAARSASKCRRARAYDADFIDECEGTGPRYQGLWQGLALASGGFLGIGLSLWWLDTSAAAAPGASTAGVAALQYEGSF